MAFLGSLFGESINEAVEEARSVENGWIIDIRDAADYQAGHIEGAINVPMAELNRIDRIVGDKGAKLFLYCYGGVMSKMACRTLNAMGYADATDIGGIDRWKGDLVAGE